MRRATTLRSIAAVAPLAPAVILASWLGAALPPLILSDDAAITLRYAERLASGRGFTYNDEERVCGTSNPLWTLAIAGTATASGVPVESATRRLALIFFIAAIAACGAAAGRAAGPIAACGVGLLLPADFFLRTQMLSGLEVPLEIALGVTAVLAADDGREAFAGLLLGLALLTKLDALALAAALFVGWRLRHGRLPWRLGLVAVTTALPWYLFATIYFGSPLPQSLIAKLHAGRIAGPDPLWVARFFSNDGRFLLWPCAALALWRMARAAAPCGLLVVVLGLWLGIHIVVYSAISLGDTYPWYLATPVALVFTLGVSAIRLAGMTAAVVLVLVALAATPQWRLTVNELDDRPIRSWEAFDADRRLAGIYIGEFAAADEVVQSGFGWVAFESRRRYIDTPGLNSRAFRIPDYIVSHGLPWDTGSHAPVAPAGYVALARFDYAARLYPGLTWFVVFGRPDSAIARTRPARDAVNPDRLGNARLAAAVSRAFRAGTPASRAGP